MMVMMMMMFDALVVALSVVPGLLCNFLLTSLWKFFFKAEGKRRGEARRGEARRGGSPQPLSLTVGRSIMFFFYQLFAS